MAGAPISILASQVNGLVRQVHGRACHILGGQLAKTGVGDGYVVFFDATTANVTLGTTVPTYFQVVSATDQDPIRGTPIAFNTALSIAAVTTPTGATGTDIHVNMVIG